MYIFIGLLIIAIGSIGVSSSYIPINKIKEWSWENFWMVQGIFAWIVFPFLGALLAIDEGRSLIDMWSQGGATPAIIYGVLWGVGGLTFGLGMRYLGVALGQSIGMGHALPSEQSCLRCLPATTSSTAKACCCSSV